jgi:hypothetical protein
MNAINGARANRTRAPLLALLTFAFGPVVMAQQGPAPAAALTSGSEIAVTESGGIAGRVHSVRLTASSGQVAVEYRAREAPPSGPPFAGSLPTERYIALWRELEAGRIWDIKSAKRTSGADLISTEVRIRLGETSHVVRWDDGQELTTAIRRLSEVARRALAAGRETAFSK